MDNGKNIFGVIVLVLIILLFSIGGYFLMKYMTDEDNNKSDNNIEDVADSRIDKTKDYIYFEDVEDIIVSEEISKMNVVFNFSNLSDINNTLKNEVNNLYSSIKYTKDMNLETTNENGEEINYNQNEEGIYSLNYRDYTTFKFGNYVSLLVEDYYYDIKDGVVPNDLKAYIVAIDTGKVYSEEEILSKFNTNWDNIRELIRKRLNDTQTLVGEENVIDIEGTMNGLDKNAIYVNKIGKLSVSFIVNSSQNNYNDSITID